MSFTAKEKLDAVDREVRLRVRVYKRLIEQGKMTAEKANREIEIMREIASDYFTIAINERLL